MAYRSMFCYAWDLAERGVAEAADELRALHINTITLAGAYHAGKFLRPHGRTGKIYFPEDGTVYFKHRPERYGDLQPYANSLLNQQDLFAECGEVADMNLVAWLVLLHNSRLGALHPDCCVSNAFGDRYIYSLCPAVPAVHDYAVALCQDITDTYPIRGLSLETPGFLPFVHGYHHEFGLVRQNSWLNNLLGLCFCDHCIAGAKSAGVEAQELRQRIATWIEDYLAADVEFPDDMAAAFWHADMFLDGTLSAFLRWRCRVVEKLVSDIRSAVRRDAFIAVIPSVARPTAGAWYEGSDLAGLAKVADFVEACFYESSPERVQADLHDVRRRLGGVSQLRAILRPGFPDLQDADAVAASVALVHRAGVQDIGFYNYGHLRQASLTWTGAALASLATGTA